MKLTKAILPKSIILSNGKIFEINTDHYYWFRFSEIIRGKSYLLTDFDFLYKSRNPEDKPSTVEEMQEAYEKLCEFFYEKKEIPRPTGDSDGTRTIDYEIDADLIYSAFMEQYGIDLVSTPLHWHKVRALLEGLHNTKLNEIMGYRSWRRTGSGKLSDHEREMQKLKMAWSLPDDDDEVIGEGDELNEEDLKALGF